MKWVSILVLLPRFLWLWNLDIDVLVDIIHDARISSVHDIFKSDCDVEIIQIQIVGRIIYLQISPKKRSLQSIDLVVNILELQSKID